MTKAEVKTQIETYCIKVGKVFGINMENFTVIPFDIVRNPKDALEKYWTQKPENIIFITEKKTSEFTDTTFISGIGFSNITYWMEDDIITGKNGFMPTPFIGIMKDANLCRYEQVR